jgi:hypothetical protein
VRGSGRGRGQGQGQLPGTSGIAACWRSSQA